MEKRKVAVLIGSLRKASFSKQLALNLKEMAKDSLTLDLIDLGNLPLYNQDYDDENNAPDSYKEFRKTIQSYDALLFITPEYNRSLPAVLKNALDVGSRPYGKSVWDGKPGAIISITPGSLGGFGANHHLRQSLVFLNVPTMQQPEVYLSNAYKLFNEKGQLIDEKTKGFLKEVLGSFQKWIEKTI